MATNYSGQQLAPDWSTPLITGFWQAFQVAKQSRDARIKRDADTFQLGLSLLKQGETLPEGMSDYMNKYMKKYHNTDVDFRDYTIKPKDQRPLTIEQAKLIIKNSEQANGSPFLQTEKNLVKFIQENTDNKGNFKLPKTDLEGYIKTYYANLSKEGAYNKKVAGQIAADNEKIKTAVKMKELSKLVDTAAGVKRAKDTVNELEKMYYSAFKPTDVKKGDILGGLGAISKGAGLSTMGTLRANPDVLLYNDLKKAFAGILAKSAFAETGVLTNPDITRALGSLPSAYSTKKEAQNKFNIVKTLINKADKNLNTRYYEITGEQYNPQKNQIGLTLADINYFTPEEEVEQTQYEQPEVEQQVIPSTPKTKSRITEQGNIELGDMDLSFME